MNTNTNGDFDAKKTCANERAARALAKNHKQLKHRLKDARSVLVPETMRKFGRGKFDFANRQLVSDDGSMCLQWLVRPQPDKPVSATNQQTSRGVVGLRIKCVAAPATPEALFV